MIQRIGQRKHAMAADPPQVGLIPVNPQVAEGKRIDPPVSLPSDPKHIPAAVATPDPVDEEPTQ